MRRRIRDNGDEPRKEEGQEKVLPPLLGYAQELVQGYRFDKEKTIGPIAFKPYDALVIGRDDGYAKEFPLSLTGQILRMVVYAIRVTNASCRSCLRSLHVS
jgi:hypothetical protein